MAAESAGGTGSHGGRALAMVVVLILASHPGTAATAIPSGLRLWVLQEGKPNNVSPDGPAEIIAFDPADFSRRETVSLPTRASQVPSELTISRQGQILFPIDESRAWLWSGEAGARMDSIPPSSPARLPPGTKRRLDGQWMLGADGHSVYLAQNEFTITMADGYESAVRTHFRILRHDLASGRWSSIHERAFEPCDCGTGECSETCPQAGAWAPDKVVDDFLYVTHWVPGQLGATYGSTFVLRRQAGSWRCDSIPSLGADYLDATAGGSTWIEAIPDGGCCGWANESDDMTTLARGGVTDTLFDEWPRFHNQSWDVSFYTERARLAPDGRHVALTVKWGGDLRLSDDSTNVAHPDSVRLSRIRSDMTELPAVEVLTVGPPVAVAFRIPRAELVGWLNDSEIVVVEGGQIIAVDVATKHRRESGIPAPNASFAFLPRR